MGFRLRASDPTPRLQLGGCRPASEVAFCGHATLGAFHVLAGEVERIRVREGGMTHTAFTCKSGRLNVELSRKKGKLRVLIETPASCFEPLQLPAEVITRLGLVPEALDPKIPPQKSAILEGYLYLAVRDRQTMARCRPDGAALA